MIDIYGGYVYKKDIDWSVLHEGISIPVNIQKKFLSQANSFLERGQWKYINLVLNGKTFRAELRNQSVDQVKYGNRADIVQVRYSPTSDIAVELRTIFGKSYEYLKQQRDIMKEQRQRKILKLPDDIKESIALYLTEYPDTYVLECFTVNDYDVIQQYTTEITEQEFEHSVDYNLFDETARLEQRQQMVKIRRLNRAIGECLKELYNYQCQVCGANVSSKYDVSIVESHHLEPFVSSLNNNTSNQIVLCPNHHSVVHKAEPEFRRAKLMFIYKNGLEERISLNKHLW